MNAAPRFEPGANVDEGEIRLLAYQLWERAGRPVGLDLEFWLRAEAQWRAAKLRTRSSRLAGDSDAGIFY